MPRIRTVKPEFCTSEQIVECSTSARLLFVLMWCFCDDAGRHPANVKRLKMEVFPGDPFTDKQVRGFVDELIHNGLMVEYIHENKGFWQVTGWKHQKIDRPNYKYGPLDENGHPMPIDEHSTNDRRTFEDHSPPEGNGREGKGEEGSGKEVSGVVDEATTPLEDELTEFTFVVCDGSEWTLSQRKLSEYRSSFPELGLEVEFRKAAQWLRDNPSRRKTRRGMHKFLGSWLARVQDSGGAGRRSNSSQPTFAQQRVENSQRAIQEFINAGE